MTATHDVNPTIPTDPGALPSPGAGPENWKLAFTVGLGQKPRLRTIAARDTEALMAEITAAKKRFGLPENASVVSCYKAGRDGFRLHCFLLARGVRGPRRRLLEHQDELGIDLVPRQRGRPRVSQAVFARLLNVSTKTVQSWEQGVRTPSHTSRRLIQIYSQHPETVCEWVGLPPIKLPCSLITHDINNSPTPITLPPTLVNPLRCLSRWV